VEVRVPGGRWQIRTADRVRGDLFCSICSRQCSRFGHAQAENTVVTFPLIIIILYTKAQQPRQRRVLIGCWLSQLYSIRRHPHPILSSPSPSTISTVPCRSLHPYCRRDQGAHCGTRRHASLAATRTPATTPRGARARGRGCCAPRGRARPRRRRT
jgi:hypothetical protein